MICFLFLFIASVNRNSLKESVSPKFLAVLLEVVCQCCKLYTLIGA